MSGPNNVQFLFPAEFGCLQMYRMATLGAGQYFGDVVRERWYSLASDLVCYESALCAQNAHIDKSDLEYHGWSFVGCTWPADCPSSHNTQSLLPTHARILF